MADLDFDALIAIARQASEQIEYHRTEMARHAQVRDKALNAAYMPPKNRPRPLLDAYSRCPACLDMIQEGTAHRCPAGRHRDVFESPVVEALRAEKANPPPK